MKNNTILLFLALGLTFNACTESTENTEKPETHDLRAIVVSEGQFGYGTSSLTTLSEAGDVEQDVFSRVNGRTMGDVAQSLSKIGDNYYVTLNNSRKIEVFDSKTYKSVETMPIDLNVIPMYIQHLGGDSIAVTDQSNRSKLMIMDINHGTSRKMLRRYIDMGGSTFQMLLLNNKLFVGGSTVSVFDLGNITQEGKRTLKTKAGETFDLVQFSKILVDNKDRIWVFGTNTIYCFDPVTEKCIHEVNVSDLNINSWVSCIDISSDKKTIYFNSGRKLYSIDVNNPESPKEPIMEYEGDSKKTVYLMSVSKENTIFFVEVLYGSLTRGVVFEYNPHNASLIRSFKAGIFPHYIYFE
ncbi:MAG: DUF5074 domain-containing protein [Bacteroidales bacterium]